MKVWAQCFFVVGFLLWLVGIPTAMIGYMTIDVPVPETLLFFIGVAMVAVGICLNVTAAVLLFVSLVKGRSVAG